MGGQQIERIFCGFLSERAISLKDGGLGYDATSRDVRFRRRPSR
jgi:hypothetical protein